jgi:hypothetical protein
MYRVLIGIFIVCTLGASLTHAQLTAVAPASAQSSDKTSQQVNACQDKVIDLSGQLVPLQKKRTGLWTERKSIGTSGGDSAKYKLTNIDQEIAQVTKQIDGVTRQIDTEKKRCDDLTTKPSVARSNAQDQSATPTTPTTTPPTNKKKNNGRH